MKKRLLILACGDEVSGSQKKNLPSIISGPSLLKSRLEVLMKLKPQRIGLLSALPLDIQKSWKRAVRLLPAEIISSSLLVLLEKVKRGKTAGELLLLSSEFSPWMPVS